MEGNERGITLMLRLRPSQVLAAGGAVEDVADLDTALHQLFTRGADVRHHQVQSTRRSGCRRGDAGTEVNGALRTRWRELHQPEVCTFHDIRIEPPAQTRIEAQR